MSMVYVSVKVSDYDYRSILDITKSLNTLGPKIDRWRRYSPIEVDDETLLFLKLKYKVLPYLTDSYLIIVK